MRGVSIRQDEVGVGMFGFTFDSFETFDTDAQLYGDRVMLE